MEVIPINFNLKSELEKESILNSYKIFLKTCNFNIQILIQSNKQNLEKNINKINLQKNKESENIKNISDNYIKYIQELNQNKKSSNKNYFIIIKKEIEENNLKSNFIKNKYNENIENIEENIIEELNEKYFKIKECLARCGNIVKDINEKENVKKLINSYINKRLNLLEKNKKIK